MPSLDPIAVASLIVAVLALGISVYAIRRANATTSAATLVTLNEAFRQGWERYLQRDETVTGLADSELAELLNLLEIACAIYLEGSISGNSRKLLLDYLNNVLSVLSRHENVNLKALELLQTDRTFEFIKKFMKKKPAELSVTLPPKWYELQ